LSGNGYCVTFQNDGSITAMQYNTADSFSLGSCMNNNSCQEIYEGECGDGRRNDASCAMWVISGGDYCYAVSHNRLAYIYVSCGTSTTVWKVTEDEICIYRIYLTVQCRGSGDGNYAYKHTCPPYSLSNGLSGTCTLKNIYENPIVVTITGCSGNASFVGNTMLTAIFPGNTMAINDDYCGRGSQISNIILPVGSTLSLTESCYDSSVCSGRYELKIQVPSIKLLYYSNNNIRVSGGCDNYMSLYVNGVEYTTSHSPWDYYITVTASFNPTKDTFCFTGTTIHTNTTTY